MTRKKGGIAEGSARMRGRWAQRLRQQQWESTTRQMERVARIHSPKVESLRIDAKAPAPGVSEGGTIALRPDLLPPPDTRDGIATWIGVTMHEVGHVDFSPPLREFKGAGITSDEIPSVRLLEDLRQETLLVDRLPGVAAPLTRTVANLILDDGVTYRTWPYVVGRLYLPHDLRQAIYDIAVRQKGQEWADEVRRLAFAYMRLADPGYSQLHEAKDIIRQFAAIVGEVQGPTCAAAGSDAPEIAGIDDPEDRDTVTVTITGTGDDGESADGDEAGGGGEEAGDTGESDTAAGEGGGEDGGDESESAGDSGGGAGDGDGAADGGDGDGGGDDSDDTGDGGGTGAGSGHSSLSDLRELRELADELAEARNAAHAASAAATDQMADVIDVVVDRMAHDQPGVELVGAGDVRISQSARMASARLMTQLKPLFDDAEAGLERFTPKGRIRPDRMARGYRPDMSFDKWQQDVDEDVSAEIVVALDGSGSMSAHARSLAEATWVIRQVVERSAANLTIISWDSTAEIVRPKPLTNTHHELIHRNGGTNGLPMLELAELVFIQSPKDRKWLVVMTDGQVNEAPATLRPVLGRMEKMGVAITPLGFGQNSRADVFGDNAEHIDSLLDIPLKVGAMLYDLYRQNVVR